MSAPGRDGRDVPHLLRRDGTRTPLPSEGRLVLGSSPERADLLLAAEGVDAVHAAVLAQPDGGWTLQDLGSAGGTHVNDRRVDRVTLRAGDVVRIGAEALKVVDPRGAAAARPERAAAAPDGGPPRKLGGFVLERRLGTGGMGDVWLARQESLDRPVALKLLSPDLAGDEAFVRRFQEEARAAAALSHPNVVVVYDVGTAAGYHYLAMEYMAGGSLEDEVQARGPLPWPEAVQALRDCAAGLVYAEERLIVHRDVKPANLMRAPSGTVKLADLGLAVSTHGGGDGRVLGTPHFLAPEQARGAKPDHRADLYSLGATAYRLLTARTPFSGRSSREILRAHLTEQPEAPGAHVAGLPPALDQLVLALLAKDPDQRPASAAEAQRRLEALLLGTEEEVRGGAGRVVLALGALGALGLAGAGAWFFLLRDGEAPEPPGAGGAVATEDPDRPQPDDDVQPPTDEPDVPEDDTSFFEGGPEVADGGAELERALEAREVQARVAVAALPEGLAPARELEELRALAETYAGTPTAAGLGPRIAALEAGLAAAEDAEADARRGVELARDALSQAIGWPPAEPSPGALATWDVGETLRALFATARRAEEPGAGAPAADEDGPAPSPSEDAPPDEVVPASGGDSDDAAAEPGRGVLGGAAGRPERAQDDDGDDDAGSSGDPAAPPPATDDRQAGDAPPAESETGLAEVPPPVVPPLRIAEDPAIARARAALADEVVARALRDYGAVPTAIDLALEEARFDDARALSRDAAARTRLPEPPADAAPARWDELVALSAKLAERADSIGAEVDRRRAVLASAGRTELAAMLGPGSDARTQLVSGDWTALRTALESFAGETLAPGAASRAAGFAATLDRASAALTLLRSTHAAGEWRRVSALLPAGGRERSFEVTGVDAEGLTASTDGEAPRRLPWSAVLASPGHLHGLFQDRFARALDADEEHAVVALLRLSGALRAAQLAQQVLDPASESILSNREAEELDAVFAEALEAADDADALQDEALRTALEREAAAARLLRRALEAYQESRWTQAAADLERLLDDHPDLLLVALLSDGAEPARREVADEDAAADGVEGEGR